MPEIPAPGSWRQGDHMDKVILSYTANLMPARAI